MTEEQKLTALHDAAYDRSSQELYKRQLSNNENFDRGILTLASAGLALTITFVGNLKSVHYLPLLVLCWIAFFVAIVSTIVSYLVSQQAIITQLDLIRKYHKDRDDSAHDVRNRFAEMNEHLAKLSAGGFIAGVLLLLLFFGNNATTNNIGKAPPAVATTPATQLPAVNVVVNPSANLPGIPRQAPTNPQGLIPQP
jgi:hypothetical protein